MQWMTSKRRRSLAQPLRNVRPGFESTVTSESSVSMPKAAMQFLYHELVNTVAFTIRDVTSEYSRVLHSSCGPTPLWSGGAHCADTKGIRSR